MKYFIPLLPLTFLLTACVVQEDYYVDQGPYYSPNNQAVIVERSRNYFNQTRAYHGHSSQAAIVSNPHASTPGYVKPNVHGHTKNLPVYPKPQVHGHLNTPPVKPNSQAHGHSQSIVVPTQSNIHGRMVKDHYQDPNPASHENLSQIRKRSLPETQVHGHTNH